MKCLCALSLLLLILCGATLAPAQSTDATISGVVVDPAGRVIPGAAIEIVNDATGVHYSSETNGAGIYSVTILPPGQYRVQVSKIGFKTLITPGIILNVQSALALNFTLPIGATSETVTVDAGASQINTTDGSVSTVIDRKFVENIPLNGRSFQSLILLTPGTVTNSPQSASSVGNSGEFSVNGQRTESNYYTVDGVSANSGTTWAVGGAGTSGSLPSSTALGTTQSLVSVDALQEFRIESSTYSAEYGRNPGGQFSFVTRSGTNDWHGTTFDYFRNEALDANNWYNDNTVPVTQKTPERQNDFGGTLGGPIQVPRFYDGRNRTFFFFSYEGLRLLQPVAASINYVPTVALRQSAPSPLQQALNAFPLPRPNAPDLGVGLSEFIGSWSNPNSLDSISLRLDHSAGQRVHLFFRISDAPSNASSRGSSGQYTSPSMKTSSQYLSRTYTLGATANIATNFADDFRLNLSTDKFQSISTIDGFGGAQPTNFVSLSQLQAYPNAWVEVALSLGGYFEEITQSAGQSRQQQWNLVNAINIDRGRHALKLGIDWRQLSPSIQPTTPINEYFYFSTASIIANSVDLGVAESTAPSYPVYTNFSAFVQDSWRLAPRLTVSTGVRWDVNPAPGASKGLMPNTVSGLDDPASMSLAPQGTALWKTSWYNLAPRVGVAYVLNNSALRETVLRGGGGVFFDSGQQTGSYGFEGAGFSAVSPFGTLYSQPASFPVPVLAATPPIVSPPTTPYSYIYANPPHLQLPYTFQWNATLEQALGRSQSFTISYVGANGRKLLQESLSNVAAVNPNFGYLYIFKNGLTSSYNASQVKYQRQVARGLQALVSYTWSHSLDFGSYNSAFPYERADSDQDVRNNVAAAISYELPHSGGSSWFKSLTSSWGIDGRFTARTGFPVTLDGNEDTDPNTGQFYFGGLNLVSGVPLYLYGPGSIYPGGRAINPNAFALPAGTESGNAPRNFVRGFGAVQTDVAMRRTFPIRERLQAQFRVEAFNILNHPNFGVIDPNYGDPQFGEATATLSQSLGTLSPLYQMGGPRSLQLMLKLTF